MSPKKLGIALASVLALGALLASSAFATATPTPGHWLTEKEDPLASSGFGCDVASANMTLQTSLFGVPVKMIVSAMNCLESTLDTANIGGGTNERAVGSAYLELIGVEMVEPEGCNVGSALRTERVDIEIQTEGSTVYWKFTPKWSDGFMTVRIFGCYFATEFRFDGPLYAQSQVPIGAQEESHRLQFSSAINKTAGGTYGLTWLTGEIDTYLTGELMGKAFGVEG